MWLEPLVHDPLTRFIAQIISIVVLSRLLGVVTRRIGQPMVIAEIAAGIMLGPSLLGWLSPEVFRALFAPEALGGPALVSQLGLVFLMFLVGLELDRKVLEGRGTPSIVISYTSIVLSFALSALLAFDLYPRMSAREVSFTSFTLLLGASLGMTAFPVLARILNERRLLRSKVGSLAIACATVGDVTAWCILAFVVATARAKDLESAATSMLLLGAYAIVMLGIVRPLLVRIAGRVASKKELTQNVVAAIVLLLFASSWATELIGIHALFGAFFVGVILPKEGDFAHALAEKLEDLVLVILLPLFFAYSGVRTNVGLLDSTSAWITCGLIVAVACAGKLGGSTIAARFSGLSWRESSALGVLMNTRGLMALIAANIGLDLGIISPTLFTMLVLTALSTTLITSPILDRIHSAEQLARDVLLPPQPDSNPGLPPAFTVLVCIAHDRSGPGLVSLASRLGGPSARIHALHLVHPAERVSSVLEQTQQAKPDLALGPMLERARELKLEVKTTAYVSSEPAGDICAVARAKGADLVLMGWHRPILSQTLLGGVVYHVMNDAHCDVGAFLDRGIQRMDRVLLPFVGSSHDHAALRLAKRLVDKGAEVTLLHVKKPDEAQGDRAVRRTADQVFQEPSGGMVNILMAYDRDPLEVALKESHNGYDLLIVGIGRDWGLEQRLVGVYQERLMRESPISVLVVRGGSAQTIEQRVEEKVEATV